MSKIKECFVSRWGDEGYIMNADFSQLEIIVLAHVTQDKQLADDIQSGLDLHIMRAAELFIKKPSEVTDGERKLAKAFSFQLQYGSGAKNMAEKNNVPINLAKEFIDNYYRRYPDVKAWQNEMENQVQKASYPIVAKSPRGYPIRESKLQSKTGRVYTFTEGDAPEFMQRRGKHTSFKPTEMKNYPIQGTATGDIVPMMLGKVYRWLIASEFHEDALLINTVHDSIMLDIRREVCYDVGVMVKRIMETAPQEYEDRFGERFELPLKVDVTYGPSWAEQPHTIGEF